jgi:hypothetical protein
VVGLLDFFGTLAQQATPLAAGAMRGRQARDEAERERAEAAQQQQATMQRFLLDQARLEEAERHNKQMETASLSRATTPTAYGGRTRAEWLADREAEEQVRARFRPARSGGGGGGLTPTQQRSQRRREATGRAQTIAANAAAQGYSGSRLVAVIRSNLRGEFKDVSEGEIQGLAASAARSSRPRRSGGGGGEGTP